MSSYHKLPAVERVMYSTEGVLSIPKNQSALKARARAELRAMVREIRKRRLAARTGMAVITTEEEATGRFLVQVFKAAILADKLAEPGVAPIPQVSLRDVSTDALKRILSGETAN